MVIPGGHRHYKVLHEMLIFWEKRLVFLATPKAGSTAIEAALQPLANVAVQRPAELKHTSLATYRSHIAPWLHDATGTRFTTVALMREPLGWLQSWFRFRQRDDHDDPDHAMADLSFADFTQAHINGQAGIGTQSQFLTQGQDRVDVIFRYEQMQDFTHFLEDRLDCAIQLPRLNVPPEVDVSLEAAQEQALRQFMQRDVALYAAI